MGIIEGAVAVVLGILLGRFLPSRRKELKSPKPVCGCGHHHSFHDPGTNACHGLMNGNPLKYDTYRSPTAWEQVRCSCRQYSGPVPMPEYFAAELADGS